MRTIREDQGQYGYPDYWPTMTPWAAPVPDEYPEGNPDSGTFHGPRPELPTPAALLRAAPWGSYLDTSPIPAGQ